MPITSSVLKLNVRNVPPSAGDVIAYHVTIGVFQKYIMAIV